MEEGDYDNDDIESDEHSSDGEENAQLEDEEGENNDEIDQ